MSLASRRTAMPRKRYKPEEIVAKLRQVDVLTSHRRPGATPPSDSAWAMIGNGSSMIRSTTHDGRRLVRAATLKLRKRNRWAQAARGAAHEGPQAGPHQGLPYMSGRFSRVIPSTRGCCRTSRCPAYRILPVVPNSRPPRRADRAVGGVIPARGASSCDLNVGKRKFTEI